MVLEFESSLDRKGTDNNPEMDFRTKNATTVWVTEKTGPRQWEILTLVTDTSFYSLPGRVENGEHSLYHAHRLTLTDKGGIPGTPDPRSRPSLLLPLPTDLASVKAGWESGNPDDVILKSGLSPQSKPEEGLYVIESRTAGGLLAEVYEMNGASTATFDAKRGLMTNFRSENSMGGETKSLLQAELLGVKTVSPEELPSIRSNHARFEQLTRQFQETIYQQPKEHAELLKAHRELATALQSAAEELPPPFQAATEAMLERAEQACDFLEKNPDRFSRPDRRQLQAGDASPDWRGVGMDGREYSKQSVLGKVVVMDFWFKNCGWCIKAMPQIKEVADHYRGQDVLVLGMCTDRKKENAQFIIDKLKLNYPTVIAPEDPRFPSGRGQLAEPFGISGFPTVIILDQEGVIRWRHAGYAKDLKEQIQAEVDQLLPGPS
ncbi:MAG: TlpA disulfide reductase family protein [Verrucomicrobiota bacterium]